jgi:hypothetical protein
MSVEAPNSKLINLLGNDGTLQIWFYLHPGKAERGEIDPF